jgi:hypothetical protein
MNQTHTVPQQQREAGFGRENEFLLAKKYLSMKGVFSVENHIFDNVGMSLSSV